MNIQIEFDDGSMGLIAYYANGAEGLEKECFEVHAVGVSSIIRDFKTLEVYRGKRKENKRLWVQDKGQKEMVGRFLDSIKEGKPSPIRYDEIVAVTRASMAALASLRANGKSVSLDVDFAKNATEGGEH